MPSFSKVPWMPQVEQVVGLAVVADPRPEVLAHITDAVLGLAFGLRTLGSTEPRSKAVQGPEALIEGVLRDARQFF